MELQWYQPKLASLNISGIDASDFLHRLTTQDFKNFATGQAKYAAFLEPNSKIKHLFLAEKTSDKSFLLWALPESIEKLKIDLEKFHFNEDLNFEINNQIKVIHKELSEQQRVDSGLFSLGIDVTEKNLLLEIPFEDFLARQKGCYPGQEVVERVFTYGNVTKKLMLLDLEKISKERIDAAITSRGSKKAFLYYKTSKTAAIGK
ncbi:MAG: hypothetical protein IPM57_07450 [Oligoflexia bacterium]|nr:hypothetical protein [Oligoflexia bacterium]